MNSSKENKIYKLSFEELHIRHLNLLIDLKDYQFNNWFYKMAIINTFDDLKVFLKNLERNKYKCIIAIENKKIIGFVYTYPVNNKKSCLKISSPEIIRDSIKISRRELILNLIKYSINNNLNISNWIINADINDNKLISSSRELGFQPLQEIILWKYGTKNINFEDLKINQLNNYIKINNKNIKKFLNFVRSNQSILIRNLHDFDCNDIRKRADNNCGMILNNEEILFGILKDINYENKNVYSLIKGGLWNSDLYDYLKIIIFNLIENENNIIFKTNSQDKELNSYLLNLNLSEIKQELLLVRNTLIKRDIKSINNINNSWESFLERINPQGNVYPSPMPIKLK